MFKFTLTVATSVFLLMSGASDLFAMESLYDDHDNALSPINHLPEDIMKDIFIEATKDTNPRHLTSVCKDWYSVMRENNSPQMAELHYSATNILDSTMNPFMQRCMNTYWENQFYNGVLRYMPTDGSDTVTLKFSDFKDGTFDLSTCGNTGQYLVITESMDRFFTVEQENKNKTVILIALRHLVEQGINESKDPSFGALMKAWDADKAPVGMFWRWGNDTELTWVDYLTTASMAKVASRNVYENWDVAGGTRARWRRMACAEAATRFHVCF